VQNSEKNIVKTKDPSVQQKKQVSSSKMDISTTKKKKLYSPSQSPEKITPNKRKKEGKDYEPEETKDCKKCNKLKSKKNKWNTKVEELEGELKKTVAKLHAAEMESCTLKGKLEVMEKVYSAKK